MGADAGVQHSDNVVNATEGDGTRALQEGRGRLFRAAVGCGGVLFVAVLGLGLYNGVDPSMAFFRALVALLVLAVCGWLAEQVTPVPLSTGHRPLAE